MKLNQFGISGGIAKGLDKQVRISGKSVNVQGNIGIFHVAGGKAKELRLSWDKYALLQQLGALASQAAR